MPVVYSMMCTGSCLVILCMLNACSCGAYHDCLSWLCPNTFKCNFKVEQHLFTTVNLVYHTMLRLHVLQFCRCANWASDKGIETRFGSFPFGLEFLI